jgi:hypothetical protein
MEDYLLLSALVAQNEAELPPPPLLPPHAPPQVQWLGRMVQLPPLQQAPQHGRRRGSHWRHSTRSTLPGRSRVPWSLPLVVDLTQYEAEYVK